MVCAVRLSLHIALRFDARYIKTWMRQRIFFFANHHFQSLDFRLRIPYQPSRLCVSSLFNFYCWTSFTFARSPFQKKMYINRAVALIARDWEDDAKSTGKSFKSWKSCQNNRTCHIIAIVGFVLAALCIFWVLSTLIRCLCMGYSCLEALCCCCCRNAHSNRYVEQPQQVFPQNYSQHYTHQREPPMTRAEPAYQPMNQYYPAEKATTPADFTKYPHEESYRYDTGYKPLQF